MVTKTSGALRPDVDGPPPDDRQILKDFAGTGWMPEGMARRSRRAAGGVALVVLLFAGSAAVMSWLTTPSSPSRSLRDIVPAGTPQVASSAVSPVGTRAGAVVVQPRSTAVAAGPVTLPSGSPVAVASPQPSGVVTPVSPGPVQAPPGPMGRAQVKSTPAPAPAARPVAPAPTRRPTTSSPALPGVASPAPAKAPSTAASPAASTAPQKPVPLPVGWLTPQTLKAAGIPQTLSLGSVGVGQAVAPATTQSGGDYATLRAIGGDSRVALSSLGGDLWSIQSTANGMYWAAELGYGNSNPADYGYATVRARSASVSTWETFRIERMTDGRLAFYSVANSRYLRVYVPDGTHYQNQYQYMVRAAAPSIDTYTLFEVR